jgi:hypothetical protein
MGPFAEGYDCTRSGECLSSRLRAGMTRPVAERPRGCMVTLTFFGDHGPHELDGLLRSTRSGLFDLLVTRLQRAVDEGELSQATDIVGLARFVQIVHSGMTVCSRDGADRAELQAVVDKCATSPPPVEWRRAALARRPPTYLDFCVVKHQFGCR